jgi:hypothetical protein
MTTIRDVLYRFQLLVAALAVVVIYFLDHRFYSDSLVTNIVNPVRKETYGAIATIFGALLGFVITAFSIVVSLGDSQVIKKLKKNGDYRRVPSAFILSTYIIGVATATSLLAIFLDADSHSANRAMEYVVLFVSLWAALAVMGIVFVLELLVSAAGES